MEIDFKSEAVEFARENGIYPAAAVQKAMERGAELAVIRVTEKLKSINSGLEKARAAGAPVGETKTVAI